MQKIIAEVLASPAVAAVHPDIAPTMTFARETRDLLIECCVEFITMLSSEANEIAEKDAKKTIACEHVTKALQELGFEEYVPELLGVAENFKTSQVVRISPSSLRELSLVQASGLLISVLGCHADPREETIQNRAIRPHKRPTHRRAGRTLPLCG